MLKVPAPFPHVGSYALAELDGAACAVRILARDDRARTALIAIVGDPDAASGNRNVPLAQLADPTPLSAAEQRELRRLENYIFTCRTGGGPLNSRKVNRLGRLSERRINAITLANLLAVARVRAA